MMEVDQVKVITVKIKSYQVTEMCFSLFIITLLETHVCIIICKTVRVNIDISKIREEGRSLARAK